MQQLCETCVHRDKLAGGRGDCVVRMWDTDQYGQIAVGLQRYCPHRVVVRVEVVPHPGQLRLEVEG